MNQENKQMAIVLVHILYSFEDATRDMDTEFNKIIEVLKENPEAQVRFQAAYKDLMADLQTLVNRIQYDVQVLSTPAGFEFYNPDETIKEEI